MNATVGFDVTAFLEQEAFLYVLPCLRFSAVYVSPLFPQRRTGLLRHCHS